MKTVEVETLKGLALNWVLAQMEGKTRLGIKSTEGGKLVLYGDKGDFVADYTTNIKLAWPLIEAGRVAVFPDDEGSSWMVAIRNANDPQYIYKEMTTDPLEGALRCCVARHQGSIVQVPDDLLS